MHLVRIACLTGTFLAGCLWSFGQVYAPSHTGIKRTQDVPRAFTGATVHAEPGRIIENATLLVENGRISEVGQSVEIPKEAVVQELKGKHIYPSFIELFSDFSMKKLQRASGGGQSDIYDPTREGYYWNDHIRSEQQASESLEYDTSTARALRSQGFGVVNAHVSDGIARGTGVLLGLKDDNHILLNQSGSYFSFTKSIQSRQSYPTSLMGALALLRQLHYDLEWFSNHSGAESDRALNALWSQRVLIPFFDAGGNGNPVRAAKLGTQFGRDYVILGGGDEFEYTPELKQLQARLVLPVNFPDAYDVSDPFSASRIPLTQMRYWNQAPSNPARVKEAGLQMALSSHGLKKKEDFLEKVREAIRFGLSEEDALASLTTVPALFLGKQEELGAIRQGYLANFIVTTDPVFDRESQILENWVMGTRYEVESEPETDIRGNYSFRDKRGTTLFELTGSQEKPVAKASRLGQELKAEVLFKDSWVHIRFKDSSATRFDRFSAKSPASRISLTGIIAYEDGSESEAILEYTGAAKESDEKMKGNEKAGEPETRKVMPITYPNTAFGRNSIPEAEDMVFRNATVWTGNEILQETDVWISNGIIRDIGKDLRARGAREIDATGKHLTAGIIDEHSHIALLSVNESGHNSSAEVRMKEVIDPKDADIYRNLAGGVTTIQQLHGSANPIGGRSSIIKLKWGENAEDMIFEQAARFIKFALGENVKQSNWGSRNRFPQTRMGVEQVFVDYFSRGQEYLKKKESGKPYRVDEELEVIAQILQGERFISCHSYVQSEINMLMKVAERFNFRVNTFTHILEGYKVADIMAAHGAGGSTFSDWWAYKYEVNDAIPYNAAIMNSQGVTVAINSDDAEMSRRLNQEAGKTMKYGGMSEIEAWKTVTLNPARLLHIDHLVGSLEKGKMADLVLWTDHPMSMRAKADKTIIEGAVYFDLESDRQLRESVKKERSELINQMLDSGKKGRPTEVPSNKRKSRFTCNTL